MSTQDALSKTLTTKELAALTTRLEAPLVVQDILHNDAGFDDDVQYALHEIVSEYKPDAALLCIALSIQKIAGIYTNASPIMGVIATECAKIIDEYGSAWLDHAYKMDFAGDFGTDQTANDDEMALVALLDNVAEDLEGLGELLELASDFLRNKHPEAARMCDIFKIQALSHAMIAEEFMKAYYDGQEKQTEEKSHSAEHDHHKGVFKSYNFIPKNNQKNIISFPSDRAN